MSEPDIDSKTEAALLLARGLSPDRVGQQIGVTGRTVRRWRDDSAFEAEVRAARRAVLDESIAALGAGVRAAIAVLTNALADDNPNSAYGPPASS